MTALRSVKKKHEGRNQGSLWKMKTDILHQNQWLCFQIATLDSSKFVQLKLSAGSLLADQPLHTQFLECDVQKLSENTKKCRGCSVCSIYNLNWEQSYHSMTTRTDIVKFLAYFCFYWHKYIFFCSLGCGNLNSLLLKNLQLKILKELIFLLRKNVVLFHS